MFIVKLLQCLDGWGHLYILHFVVACRRFISRCWNCRNPFAFTSSELEMLVLLGSDSRMFLDIFGGFGIDFSWQVLILRSKRLRFLRMWVKLKQSVPWYEGLFPHAHFITQNNSLFQSTYCSEFFPMTKLLACKPWFNQLCVQRLSVSAVHTPRERFLPFLWNAIRNGYVCVSAGTPSFPIAEEFSLIWFFLFFSPRESL